MRILLFLLFISCNAFAYPNFIGKGYHACLTCHYNPYGNGPLNDYGRAVSASAIADRLFVSDKTSDEKLAENSGFLFSKPSQKWFRPSVDYRGMQYDSGIDQDNPTKRFIHMQMDATATLKFGKRDQYIATFTHGIIPDNSVRPVNGKKVQLEFSREHYIGIRPIQELGIYIGKMDKVFGIRVPDHFAYSKYYGNLHQYSAAKGILLHWGKEKFDLGIQYFDGKDDIEKIKTGSDQTNGLTTKFEYSVTENIRVGASVLSEQKLNKDKREMKAILSKVRVGKASSLMIELGEITNTLSATSKSTTSRYMFMQNHLKLTRGLNFMMTFEQYQADINVESEKFRVAPGLQYFPWQRFELRAEIYNERTFKKFAGDKSDNVDNDSWSYIGQVHLWF